MTQNFKKVESAKEKAQFLVRLPHEAHRFLKGVAHDKSESLSYLIETILQNYIAKQKNKLAQKKDD